MISNRIIKGILDEFKKDFQFENDKESKSYEKLVNYIILSKHDPDAFSDASVFETIDVDKNGTFGIDTFALIINDNLITDKSQIDTHRKIKRLDVRFVFIQTKSSTNIDSGDLLKFTTAVKNFFSINPSIILSDELQIAKELVEEVFKPENARHFANRKPKCELYFATSGIKSSDPTILGLITQEERNLGVTIPEIDPFSVRQIDADYIIDSYSEIENTFNVIIDFEKNVPCKNISEVEQSYIGYLPGNEFLKLITGTDGNIRKNLFYENVRDFQGADNAVNNEINSTLNNPELIDKFILLNNGVTIVAREFSNLRSNEYELMDYYIVNGCQTSNVIYSHRDNLKDSAALSVPVKIIHTKSSELISMLIRSTNRQTPVPDEAFVSLEKFHKRLQEYYRVTSTTAPEKLYYERRSREFSNSNERIERPRIISLHSLIRSFTSIILGEPQLVMSNNPNSILKEHASKLFVEGQSYAPYYLSSMLLFLFYKLQHENIINNKYALSRYWICWIAYTLAAKKPETGALNSRKFEQDCEAIVDSFKDKLFVEELFKKAIIIFEGARSTYIQKHGQIQNNQLIRLRLLRDIVKSNLVQELKNNS
jgi:hypothetical protein